MKRPKKAQDLASSCGEPGAGQTDTADGAHASAELALPPPAEQAQEAAAADVEGGSGDVADQSGDQADDDQADWDDDDDDGNAGEPVPPRAEATLTISLSRQLHGRLIRTAQEEGVSVAALAQELLAEGVTLRAWEIIERKSAMRGQSPSPPQGNGSGRPFGNNGNGGNTGNGNYRQGNRSGGPGNGNNSNNRPGNPNRRQGAPNNAWMEDKAAFLEYVRNQEKQRRR